MAKRKPRKAAPKRRAVRTAKRGAARKVSPIPEGLHAITPNLVFKDSRAAIAFYEKAFGARLKVHMPSPDGKATWHAWIQIGDSAIFMNDESPMSPIKAPSADRPATSTLHLYVKDCDATIARAVAAGATVAMPAQDMFWGDRMGGLVDPFGIAWAVATRTKRLTLAQQRKAGEDFARQQEPVAYPHEPGGEEYGPEGG
jgi:PhnB protein